MKIEKQTLFEKWIYISVPLIMLVSVAGRHIYNLTNQAETFAPFVPINESVWELLKTLFYPTLMFWLAAYFARYKLKISRVAIVSGAALSLAVSPFMAAGLYYFYICAFGIHSRAIDFLLAAVSVMTAQFAAHHICEYVCPTKKQGMYAFIAILIMLAAVVICTYHTPKLPIFMDPETGSYGIRRIMD